jgi:uncharacterized protein
MKSKRVHANGEKVWIVVLSSGDEIISSLTTFAKEHRLSGSQFTAIGAFRDVVLGYFDWQRKKYARIPVSEQVELLSLSGFITEGPKVHAHAVLGKSDGSACGGHLLEGHVRPTLELRLTESRSPLVRRLDPESGLPLIDLEASGR